MSVRAMIQCVTDFHVKHKFPVHVEWKYGAKKDTQIPADLPYLVHAGHELKSLADRIQGTAVQLQEQGDPRLYRAHLMIEELGELCLSMGAGEKLGTLDGGIDLLYVLLGTLGTTFNLPVDEAFEEVHASNMTKMPRTSDNLRMRNKGSQYRKPDLARVLREASDGS